MNTTLHALSALDVRDNQRRTAAPGQLATDRFGIRRDNDELTDEQVQDRLATLDVEGLVHVVRAMCKAGHLDYLRDVITDAHDDGDSGYYDMRKFLP